MKMALFSFVFAGLIASFSSAPAPVAQPSGTIVTILIDEVSVVSPEGPEIVLAPNPVSTELRLIPAPLSLDIKALEILDGQGSTVFEAEISTETQFQVELEEGYYTLKVETDDAGVIVRTFQVI